MYVIRTLSAYAVFERRELLSKPTSRRSGEKRGTLTSTEMIRE
jgi:hypothetical protein